MKVYVADSHTLTGDYDFSIERGIIEKAGYEFDLKQCNNDEDVARDCADADALLVINIKVGPKSINALGNCKVMVRCGIGYDSIDLAAATAKGICVCNIPHYCVPEVATHSMALILAATRNLLYYTMKMRQGRYNERDAGFRTIHRPATQTVGLLGFGSIARIVAKQAQGIGYQVMAYDPYLDDAVFEEAGATRADLATLFAQADILSLHVPYFEDTHHIVGKDSLAQMKDGVVIVNTARGALIDEAALIEALSSGKVGAAGLDVFEEEPFRPADHPFYHMDNVLLSPHEAYNSAEASLVYHQQIADTAVAILQGEYPYNIVNKKQLGL